jgi:tetratricopeptide (TPR) repeat protein
MTNKKNIGIILIILLAISAGVIIYRDQRASKIEITETSSDNLKKYGIEATGSGTVKVLPLNDQKLPPAPPIERAVTPLKTLLPEVVSAVEKQMAATVAILKKDPKRIDAWIDLGVERRQLGDYEGARDAWEYAKALGPNTNIVPWNNLGDLYHFYLKDYVKSEENWKKVIALKPDYIQGYRGLFELYTYSYKEKASQIPVFLKTGIAKNPTSTDLKQMLADYEKSLVK